MEVRWGLLFNNSKTNPQLYCPPTHPFRFQELTCWAQRSFARPSSRPESCGETHPVSLWEAQGKLYLNSRRVTFCIFLEAAWKVTREEESGRGPFPGRESHFFLARHSDHARSVSGVAFPTYHGPQWKQCLPGSHRLPAILPVQKQAQALSSLQCWISNEPSASANKVWQETLLNKCCWFHRSPWNKLWGTGWNLAPFVYAEEAKAKSCSSQMCKYPEKMKIRSITFYPSDRNASDTTTLITIKERWSRSIHTILCASGSSSPIPNQKNQLKATLDAGDAQGKAWGWQ